jgi:hypothetical protein
MELYKATKSPMAAEALTRIRQLYRIERDIRGRSAEERRIERQARAGPILNALHVWLIDTLTRPRRKERWASRCNIRSIVGKRCVAIAMTGASKSTTWLPSARCADRPLAAKT